MNLGRCPICKARLGLDAICQEKASRELMTKITKLDSMAAMALVSYLALFRSNTRYLANDIALRLIDEVEQLSDNREALTLAMQKTVEQTRNKSFKQMKNHNYLKQVLDDVISQDNYETVAVGQPNNAQKKNSKKSKTLGALEKLQGLKNE